MNYYVEVGNKNKKGKHFNENEIYKLTLNEEIILVVFTDLQA